MEFWDLYDQSRNKLNKTATREEQPKDGEYHMAVHMCIFNSKGEMLIQQRQSFKSWAPNKWSTTAGGCAIAGETSQQAMEREIFEEIGLNLDLSNIRPNFTETFDTGFNDVYLLERDIDINSLNLQYEEVQNVKWASIEEIFDKIDDGSFLPYYKSAIQLFFDTRKQYGVFKL